MHILRSRLWRAAVACLCLAAVACGSEDPVPTAPVPPVEQPKIPHRLLFIGNSLTEVNDLPAMVAALGAAVGVDSISTEQVLVGGFSLEDHLAQGGAAYNIAQGGWDVVVLQQGPSTQPDSRAALRRDVKIFADLAARVNARIGIYGVWPPEEAIDYLDAGIESYRLAAQDVNGVLFPAGAAWRAAWRADPTIGLYSDDRDLPGLGKLQLLEEDSIHLMGVMLPRVQDEIVGAPEDPLGSFPGEAVWCNGRWWRSCRAGLGEGEDEGSQSVADLRSGWRLPRG